MPLRAGGGRFCNCAAAFASAAGFLEISAAKAADSVGLIGGGAPWSGSFSSFSAPA